MTLEEAKLVCAGKPTSEMERIMAHMLVHRGKGVLVEQTRYRANGPTRAMVHLVARGWGMKACTHMVYRNDRYRLYYRLMPR